MIFSNKIKLFLLPMVFNVLFCNSQVLSGEWIELQDKVYYNITMFNIMEISQDSVIYYNFDTVVLKKDSSDFIESEPDAVIKNDSAPFEHYTLLKSKRLVVRSLYQKQSGSEVQKSMVERRYVRLEPIQTDISPEEVKKSNYIIEEGTRTIKLSFGEKFGDNEIFEYGNNIIGNVCLLEKRKQTFFISVYIDNDRVKIIPIKEMSPDELVLYGINEKDEIKAIKIGARF